MVVISKKTEPKSLTNYKSYTPNATFEAMPQGVKPDIQQSLLEEQGFVCAYCMRRISQQEMKIEHWNPQHKNAGDDLDYTNMLGVCLGNYFSKGSCDTYRGNLPKNKQDLKYNPASPYHAHALKIRYLADGTIESDDAKFSNQLSEVLNLNADYFKTARKRVVKGVKKSFERMASAKTKKISHSELQKLYKIWNSKDSDGKYREYFGVAEYFIKKRMARP